LEIVFFLETFLVVVVAVVAPTTGCVTELTASVVSGKYDPVTSPEDCGYATMEEDDMSGADACCTYWVVAGW